jgi:hypothetical protein
MNIYVTQLKQSIREKLDQIEDAEYLSSLDAVLTYETYDMNKEKKAADTIGLPLQKSFWRRLWLTSSR